MTVRKAQAADISSIMTVLTAAKGIMRASGNPNQWKDGYPTEETVLADIESGYGHVVVADGIVAYFAFIPSPEPTYSYIEDGAWLDNTLPYHVIFIKRRRAVGVPAVVGSFQMPSVPSPHFSCMAGNVLARFCSWPYRFHTGWQRVGDFYTSLEYNYPKRLLHL